MCGNITQDHPGSKTEFLEEEEETLPEKEKLPARVEEKQPADLQETKRKEVFFTQTEVLLSVDTKLELQNKLKK